jgi:hypothetical protein
MLYYFLYVFNIYYSYFLPSALVLSVLVKWCLLALSCITLVGLEYWVTLYLY